MRHALKGLFEEPVPASFKAGRAVLARVLGRDDLPAKLVPSDMSQEEPAVFRQDLFTTLKHYY